MFMERGVNPLGCVGGLLPTFLQMPIWIALYAMLFFAFELRQEPAFFGIFQLLPDVAVGSATLFGQFLGDLSRPDHFIAFTVPRRHLDHRLTGFNILPDPDGRDLLRPAEVHESSAESEHDRRAASAAEDHEGHDGRALPGDALPAPSGLTLYILTSSSIGIIEGRQIRKHIDSMDLTAPRRSR